MEGKCGRGLVDIHKPERATSGPTKRCRDEGDDRDMRAMDGQCGRSREPNRCRVVMVETGRRGCLQEEEKRESQKAGPLYAEPCAVT